MNLLRHCAQGLPSLDICLIHQLQKQTGNLLSDLEEVTCDILSLKGKNQD